MDNRLTKQIEIMIRLLGVWVKNPQLRLGQLIGNCFEDPDIYHKSDTELIETVERYYSK